MMSYSDESDSWPAKYFNAAKSWHTGWYDAKHFIVTPSATNGNQCFDGQYCTVLLIMITPQLTMYLLRSAALTMTTITSHSIGGRTSTLEPGMQSSERMWMQLPYCIIYNFQIWQDKLCQFQGCCAKNAQMQNKDITRANCFLCFIR